MICATCGHTLSTGARFCGGCGTEVEALPIAVPTATPASDPSSAELVDHLTALSQALRDAGTPAFLTQAIDALAAGPNAKPHRTVVVGELGRGKTTLVNRLLGAKVLPTAGQGYKVPLLLTQGEAWQLKMVDGSLSPTTLPVDPGLELLGIAGPSPVLQATDLLDTPALNEIDLDFEKRVVAELVQADTFLICVAAHQLLSQKERDLIRNRLLPLLGGDGALVVTHTDFMDNEEDRQNIHVRATRFASKKLTTFFLPADQAAQPSEIIGFIEQSAGKQSLARSTVWLRKVMALVGGIVAEMGSAPEEGPSEVAEPTREEKLQALTRLIESEHNLALLEAESILKERLGALRLALPGRVAKWTPEYAQHEGVAEVAADLQSVLRYTTHAYLSALEASLTSGMPRSIQLAAEKVGNLASELAEAGVQLGGPGTLEVVQKRNLKVPLLVVAGAAGLVLAPIVIAPAAVGALFLSHFLRKQRDEEFLRQVRDNCTGALSAWIENSGAQLIEHLRQATRPIPQGLISRVANILDSTPPIQKPMTSQGILALANQCLALAAECPQVPSAPRSIHE